jgi:GNAT superfamily N-acetyltransferase
VNGFSISLLDKIHNRKAFSCGIDALDSYFQKQIGQDSRKRVAVTYVLHDQNENRVAGYCTLSATAIELATLPEPVRKKLPSYPCLPATLIGRLAVDETYKKRGLGELILIDAMKRAYRTSLEVASFAIVVDAINHNAETFYKKYGFLDLSVTKHRLFLPMGIVAEF